MSDYNIECLCFACDEPSCKCFRITEIVGLIMMLPTNCTIKLSKDDATGITYLIERSEKSV